MDKKDETAGRGLPLLKRQVELRLPLLAPVRHTYETLFLGILGAAVFVAALRQGGAIQPIHISMLAMAQGLAAVLMWLALQAFSALRVPTLDPSKPREIEAAGRMSALSARLNLRFLAKGWTALGFALPFVAAGEALPGYLAAALSGYYTSRHFHYALAIMGAAAKGAGKAREGEE